MLKNYPNYPKSKQCNPEINIIEKYQQNMSELWDKIFSSSCIENNKKIKIKTRSKMQKSLYYFSNSCLKLHLSMAILPDIIIFSDVIFLDPFISLLFNHQSVNLSYYGPWSLTKIWPLPSRRSILTC